ncbi:MAG TPA: hypothetical protein VNQ90_04515 [Chthoniobacteraceae bacterium]|nr:hypothetical protein [Chthoniobacteraceae bacterium]
MMDAPQPPASRCGAWTATELLVVIALLAILAILLTGTVHKARQNALQAKCVARLRQIAVATLLAANENQQKLLLYRLVPATPGQGAQETTWTTTLKPYGIQWEDTLCPALPPGGRSTYIAYGRRAVDDIAKNLKDNGYQGSALGGSTWLLMLRIESPSSYVLYGDSVYSPQIASVRAGQQAYSFRLNATKDNPGIHTRHNGRANLVFVDGSLESCPPARLKELGITSGYNARTELTLW